jgi:hypothetical protein
MKNYLLIFIFLIARDVFPQVSDSFDDGDFINSPSWSGDVSDFIVNNNRQLQLNASSAGDSYLSVPANLSSLDSCEWHFLIRLDFSPSASNFSRIYLSSDQADLLQPLNGYYLQFGESLGNDAIELFRQNGTTSVSVCRAPDGQIANAFIVGIKVTRNSTGQWTILTDFSGGTNYSFAASGSDASINIASWIGLSCVYTGGNITKFTYDNFYAGPEIPDTIPPYVVSLEAVTANNISIVFSEKINSSELFNTSNYSVSNGLGNPVLIIADSIEINKCYLQFALSFQPGVTYSVSFFNLHDDALNPLTTFSLEFIFYPFINAQLYDVVFTEVYFEPSILSPLPNSEYIEILNRRDSSVNISGWMVSDGSSDGFIPGFRLGPSERVALFPEDDSAGFVSIPNALAVPGFPTLNNDAGDYIILSDASGNKIDEQRFNNDTYQNENKKDGGWSIEKIDPDFTCINPGNWKAAVSVSQGTPGMENSVDGKFSDEEKPYLLNAFLTDSFHLAVTFSEPVSPEYSLGSNYRIKDASGNEIQIAFVVVAAEDSIVLESQVKFEKGIYTLQASSFIKDCPGNELNSYRIVRFGFSDPVEPQDVIINEILFNSYEGGNDFVELYNRSQKIIDLHNWKIAEKDFSDSMLVKDVTFITPDRRLIFPGEYLVLSEEEIKVKPYYTILDPFAFLNISGMPDFNSDEGRVEITDNVENVIDDFSYSDEMHFPLLSGTKGISLERLSSSDSGNEKYNWHSAAATAGFATPGYGNSQRIDISSGDQEVSVGMEVFSPDNDGYEDVLAIHYKFPQAGTMLSLNVYDRSGYPVRTILDGQTVSNEGMIAWDGLTDENIVASTGIYILLARSFDLKGNDRVFKNAVFLTRKY